MRVAAEKPKLEPKGKTFPELARELKAAKLKKKKLEEQVEALGSLIHKIAVEKLPPLMEDMTGDFINVPGIGAVELTIEVYPSIKKDDQAAWYTWLRKNKLGHIIVEYIHPKTLQATVKEQLGAQVKFPDYVNIAKIPTANLRAERKSKKK